MFKKTSVFHLMCFIVFFSKAQPYTLELLDSPCRLKSIAPIWHLRHSDYEWMFDKDINPLSVSKGYHDEGLSAILIDKKIATRAPFPWDFLHINLTTKIVKRIPVIKSNNPSLPQTGMGQLHDMVWGFNKKLYIFTIEPSYMVSFDPYENAVHDFGNPFGNGVDCNSVSMGKDSAIYGVSRASSNGYIYTFRFNTDSGSFKIDSIYAPNASMGVAVQGDKSYTYILTGRSQLEAYSILRETGISYGPSVLSTEPTISSYSIQVYNDTIYFNYGVINYYFENGNIYPITQMNIPPYFLQGSYPSNVPPDTANYPLIGYTEDSDTLYWRFRDNPTVEHYLQIQPTVTTVSVAGMGVYKPGHIAGFGALYSGYFKYNIANNTSVPITINTGSTYGYGFKNNKLFTSTYPGGTIKVLNLDSTIYTSPHSFSTSSSSYNPQIITQISVDPITGGGSTGKFPQLVSAFDFINDTLIAWGGNINSDCSRLGNGGGLGTLSIDGVHRTWIESPADSAILKESPILNAVVGDNGFVYYSTFLNHCTEADQNDSLTAPIIKYNPKENKIEKYIKPFNTVHSGRLTKGILNQIVGCGSFRGSTQDVIYFFSEVSDEVYKTITFNNKVIVIHLGYDDNLWVLTKGELTNAYKLYKINPYSGNYSEVHTFVGDERQNYNDFIFVGGDMYLSGGIQLGRIANIAPPVANSYLSLFEKANHIMDFEYCD